MDFKTEIEELIESNLKTYRDNHDRFIADYNREIELTKEYNGRQLLELLQNADDAGSDKVLISWDKGNRKLTISNKGETFNAGGIKSLMLANLSTKTKTKYIGNKGLGFRSILNWSENVTINSSGCNITFSEGIAKNIFENQLRLSETEKRDIKETRDFAEHTIPFPVLAIPKIETNEIYEEWTTSIIIIYRLEYESDIEKQIAELKEEILLFLNHIEEITIQKGKDKIELTSIKESIDNYEVKTIKSKKWKVFSREGILPSEYQDKNKNEMQSYNLKVAFQEDLSDNYNKLFNFFPTQLSISLPCIIHGTFELNSSRNHLNESKKNEYILKELVTLLKNCVEFLTKQGVDWRPYKLISPINNSSDSKLLENFYQDLEVLKQSETIYPCINNEYEIFTNVFYYTDDFNAFFQKNFPQVLPKLLIPHNEEIKKVFNNKFINHHDLVKEIDKFSECQIDIELRAELIKQLALAIGASNDKERFSLLINNCNDVILKDELTFTPIVKSEENLKIPRSVKVDFINTELYDSLISKFEENFDKKETKARELQRSIKYVVNIQPYDSNNVIEKIITNTKDTLKKIVSREDKICCVKEMVIALYANFRNIENRQDKLKISVPLISKSENICDAEDLFLSKTYPSGEVTEIIYDGQLTSDHYLALIDFWELNDCDIDYVESFFLWLGVNKYSRITPLNLYENWNELPFFSFIFENGINQPADFILNRLSKNTVVSKIINFEIIQKLSYTKIILLAIKDSTIKRLLETNDEYIHWYYVKWRPEIISKYSYIRYQFLKSNLFTKYILEEGGDDLNKLLNDKILIDYDLLNQFGINKIDVKSILLKLGAKESFNDIPPKDVYEILKLIPEKDINKTGKATQAIYKMALESLVSQESKYPIPNDLKYFSRRGDNEEYLPKAEIYYANNSILPKRILDTLPILNLPKRIGEDNVERYFGVKSLKEFKIQVNEQDFKISSCSKDFEKLFEILKPYILAYRLESPNLKRRLTEMENKKKEANVLKRCRIHIVHQCQYIFGDNEEISIEDKEFINVKDIFYYKDSSLRTIDELRRDSLFCDAFSEMMCIIFKVNDLKNDFRQILKNDFQDMIHVAKQDLDKEKIALAFQLLGISRVEIDFWRNIFSQKKQRLIEPIDNTEHLKKIVHENLNFSLPSDYFRIDFDTFENIESYNFIKSLCYELNLNLEEVIICGLYNYHKGKFISCIKDNEYKFKQCLWSSLNIEKNSQKHFISVLYSYNKDLINHIDDQIVQNKFEFEVNYLEIINCQIKRLFNKISLYQNLNENINIENLYIDLLNTHNIEENDLIDEEIRSLLYFKGNDQIIKKYIIENLQYEDESDVREKNNPKITGNLIPASLNKSGKNTYKESNNGNGNWIHSEKEERKKKKSGKNAESFVYDTLVNKYGKENVKWVSGNSNTPDKNDKSHYDIEYRNDDKEWKYVEVKAFSGNSFIISEAEVEKALSEPNKYEMALVRGNDIYTINDLFRFECGETFDKNSKFHAHAKDYVFTFDLNALI